MSQMFVNYMMVMERKRRNSTASTVQHPDNVHTLGFLQFIIKKRQQLQTFLLNSITSFNGTEQRSAIANETG